MRLVSGSVRGRVLTMAAVAAAVLASCVTPPSGGGGGPAGLAIPSNEIPVVVIGEAYAHQLVATGASGPVTWSVIAGELPEGITLTGSGALVGVPTALSDWARVQATDDVDTVTKFLLFLEDVPGEEPTTTGAPLPEGSHLLHTSFDIAACSGPCGSSVTQYLASGQIEHLTTSSPATVLELGGPIGSVIDDGSLVAYVERDETGFTGPLNVFDADTGEVVAAEALSPGATIARPLFSADGDFLLLDEFGVLARVYDTDDGNLERTIPGGPKLMWSADSTELARVDGGVIEIFSAVDGSGASDRQLPLPNAFCSDVADWSVSGRLLLQCGLDVITVSAVDGSDVRTVVAGGCTFPTVPCVTNSIAGRFSPSGQWVGFAQVRVTAWEPEPEGQAELAYAPDAHAATATVLATRGGLQPYIAAFYWG